MPFDGQTYDHDDRILKGLIAARRLITNPEDHAIGKRAKPNGRGGIAYCALGALDSAFRTAPMPTGPRNIFFLDEDWDKAIEILSRFATNVIHDPVNGTIDPDVPDNLVAGHNNVLGHGPTLEMFDAAIAARQTELREVAYAV